MNFTCNWCRMHRFFGHSIFAVDRPPQLGGVPNENMKGQIKYIRRFAPVSLECWPPHNKKTCRRPWSVVTTLSCFIVHRFLSQHVSRLLHVTTHASVIVLALFPPDSDPSAHCGSRSRPRSLPRTLQPKFSLLIRNEIIRSGSNRPGNRTSTHLLYSAGNAMKST